MLDFTMMETNFFASVSRQTFRDEHGSGTIVFDPVRLQQVSPTLFDPASYGDIAVPVRGQGGRGAAWFLCNGALNTFGDEVSDAVLRHYRRGGWAARLSEEAYFWLGETAVRSLREFALLQQMRHAGLPVPAPIAAFYRRQGCWYQAAIVIERIPHVRSLADRVVENLADTRWADVGIAVARCHRYRVHHADLNANNILINQEGSVFLIDWDKGRFEATIGAWCGRVLDRLERSLYKVFDNANSSVINKKMLEQGMSVLRAAHDKELLA